MQPRPPDKGGPVPRAVDTVGRNRNHAASAEAWHRALVANVLRDGPDLLARQIAPITGFQRPTGLWLGVSGDSVP